MFKQIGWKSIPINEREKHLKKLSLFFYFPFHSTVNLPTTAYKVCRYQNFSIDRRPQTTSILAPVVQYTRELTKKSPWQKIRHHHRIQSCWKLMKLSLSLMMWMLRGQRGRRMCLKSNERKRNDCSMKAILKPTQKKQLKISLRPTTMRAWAILRYPTRWRENLRRRRRKKRERRNHAAESNRTFEKFCKNEMTASIWTKMKNCNLQWNCRRLSQTNKSIQRISINSSISPKMVNNLCRFRRR